MAAVQEQVDALKVNRVVQGVLTDTLQPLGAKLESHAQAATFLHEEGS